MADIKWSAFTNVGSLETGDVLVGLRSGVNVRFNPSVFGSQVVVVTGATQSMSTNTIYIANDVSSLVTFSLPASSSVGDRISVIGQSSSGWIITQGTGQQIQISPNQTTLGATGTLASTHQYDSLNLICIVANTIWTAFGAPQSTGLTYV